MSRLSILENSSVAYAIGTVLCTLFSIFLVKLYVRRSRILQLRRQGLPMPPYNPVFGHLLIVGKLMATIPSNSHGQYLPGLLRRAYPNLGPNFYLDTWPLSSPILFIAEPATLHQVTQEHSLPKHPELREFLRPLTNGLDILSLDGQMWKTWRTIYNPGFNLNHLMTLTPVIVEETSIFCEILRELTQRQEMFRMKDFTDKLAIDVVGNVVLDTRLSSQRSENTMVNGLKRQVRWLVFGSEVNPWKKWHPLRLFVSWYSNRQMNNFLFKEFDNHVCKLQDQNATPTKSIISLALQTYLEDDDSKKSMDSSFRMFAISQIKMFLFAGHDTTSSTICYLFYLLSTNPPVLERIREEHAKIFSTSRVERIRKLKEEPYLLNQLTYTMAVMKETMRLFPAASSLRAGEPGYNVRDSQGRLFPTDGFIVWAVSHPLHRDPTYWPQPEKFLPDRWLVAPEDPLYPVKGAWRPFEFGPRNCIGQELAMMEMKIVLLMVLQEFNIEIAYEEFDRKPSRGPNTVDGERAYQGPLAGPSDNLPCRAKLIAQ